MDNLGKSAKDTYKTITTEEDKAKDKIQEYQEEIVKTQAEFQQLKSEATNAIQEINNSLGELDAENNNTLAERRVEILKEEADIQKEIADIQADPEADQTQIIDLQSQLTNLTRERSIIESSVTSDILDQAKAYDELSKTEQITHSGPALNPTAPAPPPIHPPAA